MMFIEVEQNPNSETSVFLRFKELGPAQRLRQVKSYERSSRGEWCDIVGWTDNEDRPECQAMAQPVEESGRGAAYVVYGGLWGVRLKPEEVREAWNLESPNQWGEAYLLLSDAHDLRLEEGD